MTEKGSQKRRGFCFVTFTTEEAVDKCTEQTFHTLGEAQVRGGGQSLPYSLVRPWAYNSATYIETNSA